MMAFDLKPGYFSEEAEAMEIDDYNTSSATEEDETSAPLERSTSNPSPQSSSSSNNPHSKKYLHAAKKKHRDYHRQKSKSQLQDSSDDEKDIQSVTKEFRRMDVQTTRTIGSVTAMMPRSSSRLDWFYSSANRRAIKERLRRNRQKEKEQGSSGGEDVQMRAESEGGVERGQEEELVEKGPDRRHSD